MNHALLIAGRELRASFRSPLASVVFAGGLLVGGLYFNAVGLQIEKALSADVLWQFFNTMTGVVLIASLLLGFRLLAEERQTGTMTLLSTAPIRERDVVLGKFLSGLALLALLCLLSVYMPLLIFVNGKVSWGHIAVGYLGVLLLGGASMALMLFASALANSQVVAVIIGVVLGAPLVLLWMVARVVDPPFNKLLARLALHHQNQMPFMQGVLELDRVAYYVAITFFFLLAATKTLEARRWR